MCACFSGSDCGGGRSRCSGSGSGCGRGSSGGERLMSCIVTRAQCDRALGLIHTSD